MGFKFSIDQLVDAANQYDAAGAQATAAGSTLGGAQLDPTAFGTSSTSSALGLALLAFRDQQHAATAGQADALAAFAQRLTGVSGLGSEAIDLTTAAAGGG